MKPNKLLRLGAILIVLLLTGWIAVSWIRRVPYPPRTVPVADNELHFDMRYIDSIDNPRTERSKRELEIWHQLARQKLARPLLARYGLQSDTTGQYQRNDSTTEQIGEGPFVRWRSKAAWRRDINRKIDSLKVLEHLPITPHPW